MKDSTSECSSEVPSTTAAAAPTTEVVAVDSQTQVLKPPPALGILY